MNKRLLMQLAAACVFSMQMPVQAATHMAAPVTEPAEMPEGEIRKIDKDARKITIKHGDLKNLFMPPMTMVFEVTEPAMLDNIKAGDKISFVAEKIEGRYTVTRIEVKK